MTQKVSNKPLRRLTIAGPPAGSLVGVSGSPLHFGDHLVIAAEGGERDELAPALGRGHGAARSVLEYSPDDAPEHPLPALLLPLVYVRP